MKKKNQEADDEQKQLLTDIEEDKQEYNRLKAKYFTEENINGLMRRYSVTPDFLFSLVMNSSFGRMRNELQLVDCSKLLLHLGANPGQSFNRFFFEERKNRPNPIKNGFEWAVYFGRTQFLRMLLEHPQTKPEIKQLQTKSLLMLAKKFVQNNNKPQKWFQPTDLQEDMPEDEFLNVLGLGVGGELTLNEMLKKGDEIFFEFRFKGGDPGYKNGRIFLDSNNKRLIQITPSAKEEDYCSAREGTRYKFWLETAEKFEAYSQKVSQGTHDSYSLDAEPALFRGFLRLEHASVLYKYTAWQLREVFLDENIEQNHRDDLQNLHNETCQSLLEEYMNMNELEATIRN